MLLFRCSIFTSLVLAAGTLASAPAQQPAATVQSARIEDPANLTGERVSPPDLADTLPINHGAPALQQLLLKLRTRASMMMIVAHPDDEDGGLLAYESRGQGARVAMLTLTRGEGGQNLMTADFDDALGLLRTQELLAADRYMGVDQMFGTEVDFGFSKTKEESLKKWSHDRVLYDAVRAVRLYRPLVLASVFVGGVTDGHGQHQVSGEICQEVFLAAADPHVFPEMIAEGLLPWAPLKVYARVPFSRVTPQGMFDYATGKWSPPLFHNYISGRDITTEPAATVLIHEGETSTALGMDGDSYVQFARRGLALQKTQIGAGVRLAPAGVFDVGYTRMGSRLAAQPAAEQSLFEGINTSLPGIATLAPAAPPTLRATLQAIDAKVAEAQRLFDPADLERTAPPLREALRSLDLLIAQVDPGTLPRDQKANLLHELRIKRVQLNNALVLALGVTLEPMSRPQHKEYARALTTSDPSIYSNCKLTNAGAETLKIVRLNPEDEAVPTPAVHGQSLSPGGSIFVESDARSLTPPSPTRPFFSRPDIEQPFYNIADRALRNAPATPPPLVSSAIVEDQGVSLEVRAIVPDPQTVARRSAPASTPATLPVAVPQAAVIVPPVTVKLGRAFGVAPFTSKTDLEHYRGFQTGSSAGVIPLGTGTVQLGALLGVDAFQDSVLGLARLGPKQIPVTLKAPGGWRVSEPSYNPGVEPVLEHFTVNPGALKAAESYLLTATATLKGRAYTETFRPVGYPGLTYTNFYTPATYKATAVDVRTAPNLHIAYLPGTGDAVPAFLPDLGITPTIIVTKDLTAESLKPYDAVVLGVRAYAAHPELAGSGSKPLLDYANAGGIVIVQYNTARYSGTEAPFPIAVPGDPSHNVVEEAQPVSLLVPDAPVFAWPNRITSADFERWVAERGHGFAASWDPHYIALTETHDPGQDPQKGGLLYAKTGKGAYIYLAYALYRQLPEGVPGPYRIFANLLSLGKNPDLSH